MDAQGTTWKTGAGMSLSSWWRWNPLPPPLPPPMDDHKIGNHHRHQSLGTCLARSVWPQLLLLSLLKSSFFSNDNCTSKRALTKQDDGTKLTTKQWTQARAHTQTHTFSGPWANRQKKFVLRQIKMQTTFSGYTFWRGFTTTFHALVLSFRQAQAIGETTKGKVIKQYIHWNGSQAWTRAWA